MALSAGDRLGRYEILEPLGAGGMGEVYRARDTELERDVAIKVLPEAVALDPDRLERFEREAKAVAKLSHPNILDIHDYGHEGEINYLVTELLEGETLRERLEGGALGWRKATEIGAAIADGLGAAHEAGIVHRDLKPSNVFLTADGRVKVLDFGLARHEDVEASEDETHAPTLARQTDPGTVLGTVGYMSPEQVRGETVDQRSDIFSLGCVLYEMACGQQTFKGDTAVETMNAILKEEPDDVSGTGAVLPSELAGTIRRCLEKRPQSRFQSASDLAYNLRTISSASAPSVIGERPRLAGRRKWAPWTAVAAVLVAVVAVVLWQTRTKPAAETSPDQPKRIVVLPFENLGLPEDEYFAAGMTEEITSRLAAVSDLQVVSRSSAMYYKDRHLPVRQVGEELDVGYVLEGTIRWDRGGSDHGRVRITPQLIRVADDSHLWSERYDRVLDDIFAVQSEIAEAVVGQLGVALLPAEQRAIAARPTESLEAHQAYLRGLEYWRGPDDDKESCELAVRMFERAVDHDPAFVAAHAFLSESHSFLYHLWYDRSPERLEAAREAALRALELDPDSPEGHRALGSYHYWGHKDYQQALEEYSLAAKRLPNDSGIVASIGWVRRRQGRFDEAIVGLEKALELDPRNANLASELAATYRVVRHYPEADRYYDLSISLAPDQVTAYTGKAFNQISWEGSLGLARATLESIPRVDVPEYISWWVRLEWCERDYQAALDRLAAAPDGVFGGSWSGWKPRAQGALYSLLNQPERARASYEAARVVLEKRAKETPQDELTRELLGFVYAGLGRKADAIREAREAVELLPVSKDAFDGVVPVRFLAIVYTMVGEYDAAIGQLEYLLSIPSWWSAWDLRLEPRWDPLREHPRFQEILEKYGEEQ